MASSPAGLLFRVSIMFLFLTALALSLSLCRRRRNFEGSEKTRQAPPPPPCPFDDNRALSRLVLHAGVQYEVPRHRECTRNGERGRGISRIPSANGQESIVVVKKKKKERSRCRRRRRHLSFARHLRLDSQKTPALFSSWNLRREETLFFFYVFLSLALLLAMSHWRLRARERQYSHLHHRHHRHHHLFCSP